MYGKLEVVKYLVGAKASLEVKNNNGRTPLESASDYDHDDVVKFLS